MWCQDEYQKALIAYRKGFGWGVLIGLTSWLIMGKAIYSLPILLGLLIGAIAFQFKLREQRKKEKNV